MDIINVIRRKGYYLLSLTIFSILTIGRISEIGY